tara:strand:- start:86 stop:484 length:399 start_codon:yes stop_codon:yes gene_type:complete
MSLFDWFAVFGHKITKAKDDNMTNDELVKQMAMNSVCNQPGAAGRQNVLNSPPYPYGQGVSTTGNSINPWITSPPVVSDNQRTQLFAVRKIANGFILSGLGGKEHFCESELAVGERITAELVQLHLQDGSKY